jgi:hypothetical protein
MAVLALAAAGALAGSAIGATIGYAAIGASIGWVAGSIVGNMLFPPKVNNPPLPDAHLQVSSHGTFIPILYGSIRTKAIIVDGPDQFTKHEGESGGKGGGGSEPTPDTYSVEWLRCVLCESVGDHTIGRIWHTGRIVADYRTGADTQGELSLTIYDGASDQAADPTEESHYGAGLVSAYRNVASVVYAPLDLGDTSNALPNINIEVIQGAIHTDQPLEQENYNANSSRHGRQVVLRM